MVKRVEPSVVVVRATIQPKKVPLMPGRQTRPFFPPDDLSNELPDFFAPFGGGPNNRPEPGPAQGLGSGFLIDKRGYIVTNHHVIDGADRIDVQLSEDETLTAKVVGRDPKSDLAVLKIEAGRELPFLEWADSETAEVGDWAVAIGSPFTLSHTVTSGIVSAKKRDSASLLGSAFGVEMIQTDAAINPGNSGGPLVGGDGKVIGVNTAIFSRGGGSNGVGFAIASNVARDVTEALIKDGKVTRGYLGVQITKAPPSLAKELGSAGVLVSSVEANSPAEKAGLVPGDLIVAVDGTSVKEVAQVQNLVARHKPGEKVALKLTSYQSKKTRDATLAVGHRPEEPLVAENKSDDNASDAKLGFQVAPDLRVTQVAPGSPAAEAGVQPGDRVVSVNREPVKSPEELRRRAKGSKGLALVLQRNGREIFVHLPAVG